MSDYIINNNDVFYLNDFNANYLLDIEKLNSLNKTIYLFVDGYAQCLDIFDLLKDSDFMNLKFVFSERTTVHNGLKKDIVDQSKSIEISIDRINNDESKKLIDIVSDIGYWGEKSRLNFHEKIKIVNQNNNEISLNLLSLFDSNHIKDKLVNIVSNIKNQEYKDTLFSICLLVSKELSILKKDIYDGLKVSYIVLLWGSLQSY